MTGIEPGEHVRLVLLRVVAAGEEPAAVAPDDPRVVAGREPGGADPLARRRGARRSESFRCSECRGSGSRPARIRRRTARRRRGGTARAGRASRAGRRARGTSRARRRPMRASSTRARRRGRPGRVQSRNVTPTGSWPASRAREQRDRAVHPAAHRHGHASAVPRLGGPDDRAERVVRARPLRAASPGRRPRRASTGRRPHGSARRRPVLRPQPRRSGRARARAAPRRAPRRAPRSPRRPSSGHRSAVRNQRGAEAPL